MTAPLRTARSAACSSVAHASLFLVASIVAVAMGASSAHAQAATGTLRGTIRDSAGAPLADAQVQVTNAASGTRRGTLTNASGSYNIGGLQPGSYTVRVLRIGYAPVVQTVRLPVGEVVTRDFRASAAGAQQIAAVEVTATTRALDRTTSEVASNVSTEQIENLPQNNRNFLDFAALAPGVQRRNSGISAGGISENQANLFIDGASYKSDLLPGGIAGQDQGYATRTLRGVGKVSGNPFPQSAVQEFRVVTQNFKAEYQRATGAVVTAATRSGTNEVTGDLFFYGQNKGLLATSYWDQVDDIEKPDYGRGQFGGSVGGPIIRDKMHYFLSYEGNYVDLNSRVVFRPPPALAPDVPDSLLAGQGQYETPFQSNLFFGRADYAINEAQNLVFTANVRRDKDTRGIGGREAAEGENNVRQQIDSYLLRHNLSSGAISNEAQLGFQRQSTSNRGVGTLSRLDYGDYAITRGSFPSFQEFEQDRWTLRDDLQWSLGTHVVKGGAIVEHLRYDIDKRNSEIPVFNFNPPGVGAPAGLGIDVPYRATMQIGNGIVNETNTQLGFYLQDDWTIANRLTLSFGLRWDYETNALNNDFVTPQIIRDSVGLFLQTHPYFDGERYSSDGADDRKPFTKAWQPRVGFSYDFAGNGNTVVYGGYGGFYDRIYADILLDERLRTQRPQYNFFFRPAGTTLGGPDAIDFSPAYYDREALIDLIEESEQVKPEAFLVPDDLRPPRSNHFNLGLRQQLADGRYQLSLTGTAVNGYNGFRYVWGHREIRPGPTYGSFQSVPGFGAILRATDSGRSWYRALLFQASRPLTADARWGGDLSYTLAESETNTVNGDDPFALDYVSEQEFTRIRSPFDERHRIVLNVVTRLPWDIRFSTVTTLGSGIPYLTSTNCDATQAQLQQQLAANPNDQRLQFCQANQYYGNGNGPDFDDNPPGKTGVWGSQPEKKWFGPFGKWAFRQVDLRFQKDFDIARGAQQASLFFDVYNVFNFDNFNYEFFRYGLYNDRAREPLPFVTYDSRRAQLGVRYGFGRGR